MRTKVEIITLFIFMYITFILIFMAMFGFTREYFILGIIVVTFGFIISFIIGWFMIIFMNALE